SLRPSGPGRTVRHGRGHRGLPDDRVAVLAPLLRRGANGVADPLARVQTAANVPAPFTGRGRGVTTMRAAQSDDLCFLPATELVRLYRMRKISPLEVVKAIFARIDAVNPTVNAYVTLARESAMAEARRATRLLSRRSATLPPLHGVPV